MSEDWDYDGFDSENGTAGNRGAAGGQPSNEGGSTGASGHRPAHAANPSAYASGGSADASGRSAYSGEAADDRAAAPSNASRRSGTGEAPTNWDYSSSGSSRSGGGSGRHKKDGGGNGGGRKRNRGVIIAIVVLVVAVVGIVAAVVELTKCDHEWAEATCTEPATCTKCGETEGEALGHDWEEATCTEPETCSRCGETEGEALGHDWEDATCTEPETCSVCGEIQGDPLGHTVEEWTVVLEPTCAVEGEQTGTCTVCGEEVTEAIDTTDDHTEGEWSFVYNYGEDYKELTCAVCGEVLETEDATVYNWGDYVVGEDLPAGEYKLYAYTSSESGGSIVVFPDSSSTSAVDQLIITSFDDCFYITVADGQYMSVLNAVIVPVEEAGSTALTETVSEGMYKVGYDIEPGEYRVSFTSDESYSYAVVLSSSDVTSNADGSAWVDDVWYSDTDGEGGTITVSEGQYVELYGATIELVD